MARPRKEAAPGEEHLLHVETAVLHSATMLPGGKTEVHLNQAKLPGVELKWDGAQGLYVTLKGKTALLPCAAVKAVYF